MARNLILMARRTLVEASFIFFFVLLVDLAYCKEILVGGKPSAWKIPSSPSDSLNKWAESLRFHLGDSLVWEYDGEKDSALQVTKEAYINCNTTNPAANYSNGDTKMKLERSGPFFFISGSKSNCIEGKKLEKSGPFFFIRILCNWNRENKQVWGDLHKFGMRVFLAKKHRWMVFLNKTQKITD